MKKISKVDAYQGLGDIDFKVMDQELELAFNSDQRGNQEMSHQFFLGNDGYIVLEILWDNRIVQTLRFENKGSFTEEEKNAVGRPPVGVTKKVSLTLPEAIWEYLETVKGVEKKSLSAAIRDIMVHYYEIQKKSALERDKDGSLKGIIENNSKYSTDYDKFVEGAKNETD